MENHLSRLHLNIYVFPEFNQRNQLNIDRNMTEMMIYSGVSYFSESVVLERSKIYQLHVLKLIWSPELGDQLPAIEKALSEDPQDQVSQPSCRLG